MPDITTLLPIPGPDFVVWVEPDTATEFLDRYQAAHGDINAVLDAEEHGRRPVVDEGALNDAINTVVDTFLREHGYSKLVECLTEEEIDNILALRPPKGE